MPERSPQPQSALLRILDANQNRCREGLRVIEEYLRFTLNDAHLTGIAKGMRHRLQTALSGLPRAEMLLSRDTTADVGTQITTPTEAERRDTESVVSAAFARVQQSLRTLEEYGKTLDPAMSAQIEQIRYDSYTLEKAIGATSRCGDRLAQCQLYVLIDGGHDQAAFTARAGQLIDAGVDALQLRDKRLDDHTLLSRAKQLRSLTAESSTLCIVNDRADIALLAQADGVHVGQEELPVSEVRKIVGPAMLIGLSTHCLEQARAGILAGADYLGVGPVFPSKTKSFEQFAGLEFVREVAAEIRLPAFAIGGIDAGNVEQVVQQGISRVAVGGALALENDTKAMIDILKEKLHRKYESNQDSSERS